MGDSESGPIFVGGYLRSGTTLMRYLLDSHSEIACGPETEVFVHEVRRCVEEIFASDHYEEYLRPFGLSPDDVYRTFGRGVMQSFFERHRESKGKRRWADKTPANALHFEFLSRCFPEASFIHVIRDGRDVCLSMLTWPKAQGPVAGLFLEYFVFAHCFVGTVGAALALRPIALQAALLQFVRIWDNRAAYATRTS